MSIENIKFGLGSIKPLPKQLEPLKNEPKTEEKKGSFVEMFKQAIKDVNDLQIGADKKIEGLMLEKPGISAHDAMIALEKASIAFQMMTQIRRQITRAYEEVMRTQV
ncbi:MAG: flagellar hook-basal body complex protein FliE [Deltaproteobacteria bacterium]|nr:flagellar hook-basal body complex protein FliE [Deltaproteobacteria bacterium]